MAGELRTFSSWRSWPEAEPALAAAVGTAAAGELERAYRFAEQRHAGQQRPGGEPYVEHLLEVLEILVLGVGRKDLVTLVAGLLHDVVEDTDCTQERLRAEFGTPVGETVAWLTAPEPAPGQSKEKARRGYLERLRRAPRNAVTAKLADRYSNVQRLDTHPRPAKRASYYTETVNNIVPLAADFEAFRSLFAAWQVHYAYLVAPGTAGSPEA